MIFHRTPINCLLVNLAVADILYAAFIAPNTFVKLASIHPDGVTGTVLCKVLTGGNLAWVAGTSSVVTLVAIAAERYYAVIYPIGSIGKLTKCKLKVRQLLSINTNYLITESDVVTGKSQTEAPPRPGLRFSRDNLTVEFIKLFIIWNTEIKQKSQT